MSRQTGLDGRSWFRVKRVQTTMAADKTKPLVGILMGSKSDWEVMQHCAAQLEDLDVPWEAQAISAHRAPDALIEYLSTAMDRGLEVIIAAAAGAAPFAGVCAAITTLH